MSHRMYMIRILFILLVLLFGIFAIVMVLPRVSLNDGNRECMGCAVVGPVTIFLGSVVDSRESECRSYWKNAQPFSVAYYNVKGNTLTMTLTNRRNETLKLTRVYVDGMPVSLGNLTFLPNETRNVSISVVNGCHNKGDLFDYNIEFVYDNSHFSGMQQIGARSLFGRC